MLRLFDGDREGVWRARRQPLLDRALPLLVFALVAFAPICLEAQNKTRRAVTAKSQASKTESQSTQIVFDYYPSTLFASSKESESVFVAIARDGSTQAVRYGQDNPAIIAVYEGKLPKADVARLIASAKSAIPKASEINIAYVGSCDAESFQLSLNLPDGSGTQAFMQYPGCLPVMPKEIMELVGEMRAVWRRLDESRLAYGYVRSFVFEKDFLKSPYRNIKQFASIRKFPPKLRTIVRDVSKHSPRFYPINQVQFKKLRALASDPSHFFVIDNGHGYSLTLFLARKSSHSPPSSEVNEDSQRHWQKAFL